MVPPAAAAAAPAVPVVAVAEAAAAAAPERCHTFPVETSSTCQCCVKAQKGTLVVDQAVRKVVEAERQALAGVVNNAPLQLELTEMYYLVPSSWVQTWQTYQHEGMRTAAGAAAAAEHLRPQGLGQALAAVMCTCGNHDAGPRLVVRPPRVINKRNKYYQENLETDELRLITKAEWLAFKEHYQDDGGTAAEAGGTGRQAAVDPLLGIQGCVVLQLALPPPAAVPEAAAFPAAAAAAADGSPSGTLKGAAAGGGGSSGGRDSRQDGRRDGSGEAPAAAGVSGQGDVAEEEDPLVIRRNPKRGAAVPPPAVVVLDDDAPPVSAAAGPSTRNSGAQRLRLNHVGGDGGPLPSGATTPPPGAGTGVVPVINTVPAVCEETLARILLDAKNRRLAYSKAEVFVELVDKDDIGRKEPTSTRTSKRTRRNRVPIEVTSTSTLRDLRFAVLQSLCVHPTNQKLYVRGELQPMAGAPGVEVDSDAWTMAKLEIFANEEIRLVDSGEVDNNDLAGIVGSDVVVGGKRRELETGFNNTLLSGGCAAQPITVNE